jgi:hypothetical protein
MEELLRKIFLKRTILGFARIFSLNFNQFDQCFANFWTWRHLFEKNSVFNTQTLILKGWQWQFLNFHLAATPNFFPQTPSLESAEFDWFKKIDFIDRKI